MSAEEYIRQLIIEIDILVRFLITLVTESTGHDAGDFADFLHELCEVGQL